MFASLAILATVDVLTAYLPVLGTQRGLSPPWSGPCSASGPPPPSCPVS